MSRNQEYVEQYAEYAMEQMRRYGIPASVTLAQGICESASGQSELSRKGNNHFGIKATSGWVQNGGNYLVLHKVSARVQADRASCPERETIISASRQLPVGFRTEAITSYIPMTVPTRSSVNTLLLATHMSIIPSF